MSIIFVTQKKPKYGVGHYVRSSMVKKRIRINSYFILNNKFLFNKRSLSLEKISNKKLKKIFKKIKLKIIYFDIHILNNLHKRIFNLAKIENIKIIFYDYYDPIIKKADLAFFTPSFNLINRKFYAKRTFAGWKYILFNKSNIRIKNNRKYDLLLSFGGSDPNRLTEYFINFFLKFNLNLRICCVIGYLNKRNTHIKNLCDRSNGMIKYHESKKKIDKYINESKFAIVSVGLTSYETIFFQVPSLFVPIKKIDTRLSLYFEKLKLGISSPFFKKLNMLTLKNKIYNLINKKNFFFKKKVFDGKGLGRVINILRKEYENT